MNMNLDLNELNDVKCECGNMFFQQVFRFKELPELHPLASQGRIIPLPLFVCSECGKPAPLGEEKNSEKSPIIGV